MNVGSNGNNYTSRLTLTATAELNGTIVECTLVGTNVIGSDIIKVESKLLEYHVCKIHSCLYVCKVGS